MKKIILTVAFIASGMVASAQVGVGTENPQTSLHIVGANATDKGTTGENVPGVLASTDGITVPVVTNDMTLAVPADLVAGTKVSQMVYSTFTGKQGYYYWSGTSWIKLGAVAPAFSGRTAQTSAPAYDWTAAGVGLVDFYEFTTDGGAIVLPNPATYPGVTLFVRNNTPGTRTFAGNDGIGRPKGVASLVATGAMRIWSDGTFWHNVAGRQ